MITCTACGHPAADHARDIGACYGNMSTPNAHACACLGLHVVTRPRAPSWVQSRTADTIVSQLRAMRGTYPADR